MGKHNDNIETSAKESLGLHELKQHNPQFDEECLHFLYQRKYAKKEVVTGSKPQQGR